MNEQTNDLLNMHCLFAKHYYREMTFAVMMSHSVQSRAYKYEDRVRANYGRNISLYFLN